MHAYAWLGLAIVSEVIATSALAASQGLTRLWPVVIMALGYAASFAALAFCLKTIPVAVAYAVWSGAGIALISLIGWIGFRQPLNPPALAGLALIAGGIALLHSARDAAG